MDAEQAAHVVMEAVNRGITLGLRGFGKELGRYAEGLEVLARGLTRE
jgi:hypothetical protein